VAKGREVAKREKNAPLSQALKIIMNAFYGVLGSSGCRFFDTRLASSITLRGHEIMLKTRALIEARGYSVIYGDTDSTFVWLRSQHSEEDANRVSASRTGAVRQPLVAGPPVRDEYGLTSALELQFETHLQPLPDADHSWRRRRQQKTLCGVGGACRRAPGDGLQRA
jgi:DNA polymerase II